MLVSSFVYGFQYEYLSAVGEAIKRWRSHFGVPKHRGPFAEAQVGGDDDAGAFVKLVQEVEEQSSTLSAEGQMPQRVPNHQNSFHQRFGDLASLALCLFLFQGVNQFEY